jgi:hypothetical protein
LGISGNRPKNPHGDQVAWGARLKYLSESGDYFYVESNSGTKGYLDKRYLQDDDTKVYFEGTVNGRKRFGFLYDPPVIGMLDVLLLTTTAGEVRMPIRLVKHIEITPKVMRVTDHDDQVTDVLSINGKLVYGPKQAIPVGEGAGASLGLGWGPDKQAPVTILLTRVKQ